MSKGRSLVHRVVKGFGAFLLADLITGLLCFSVITLSFLWYFSLSWVRLVGEAQAHGKVFGTASQLGLAYFGSFVTLPLLAVTIYLGLRAYRYPWRLFQGARGTPVPTSVEHSNPADYHCPQCSRTFSRLPGWAMHVRIEHAR
ncbi:MAG: hypothetical protein L3K09_02510 [Thermoplasmata archaeon]|nr:hypothetical protein [Thermoplasmata archaeon]